MRDARAVQRLLELVCQNELAARDRRIVAGLADLVGRLIEDLETSVNDLRAVIAVNQLGANGALFELLVRRLAQELSLGDAIAIGGAAKVDGPILSWREVDELVSLGPGLPSDRFPRWAHDTYRDLSATLATELFPCVFGKQAYNLRSGWFCFVDSIETEAGRDEVRRAILSYYAVLAQSPRERAILMPLLVAVKPVRPALAIHDYQRQAWDLFQYLHDHDREPWPHDIAIDPGSQHWTFCFGGRQLFSNVSHPAHLRRRARNLGGSLMFVMQPRTNFDLVAGDNPKGRQMRSLIRQRLARFEGGPPPKHLAHYGTDDNLDWKQMVVSDADEHYPAQCPLHIRRTNR